MADNRHMVTKKPKGLGMGLEALLGPQVAEPAAATGAPHTLKIQQIRAGRYQPRTHVDDGALAQLADSIKRQGLMQPVLVRPVGEGRYEIIAGERRVRAATMAGLDEVPVLVRDVPDDAAAVMALVENIQREDLNPLEEAQGLQRLIDEFGLTHEQAASAVGRSRSAASNLMRLLSLSAPVQKLLMAGEIEMGHARTLVSLPAAQQVLLAHEIIAKRLSVREAERQSMRLQSNAGQPQGARVRRPDDKSRDVVRLEEQLSDRLTARVQIRLRRRGAAGSSRGEVAISFGSLDELNGILDKLGVVEH
jgi:ParB family transcriptional regulator, chromosome partitioning protein